MSNEQTRARAQDIRTRVLQDMKVTARNHFVVGQEHLLTSLADDAMFQVEVLLSEIEQLRDQVDALQNVRRT